jgi:transcriptional regulator of acetoin/glycerol metabolism
MNYTVNTLLRFVRNGVVSVKEVRKQNYHLYKLLESNFEHLSYILEKDHSVRILKDDGKLSDDDTFQLWLLYHYGENFKLVATNKKLYGMIYYRARRQGMTVKEYLEHLGFTWIEDEPDFVHLIDERGYTIREAAAITGIPRSTVHRKYIQQKERANA